MIWSQDELYKITQPNLIIIIPVLFYFYLYYTHNEGNFRAILKYKAKDIKLLKLYLESDTLSPQI